MSQHTDVQPDTETADEPAVHPAIGEAKKYRKRAQAAEQTLSELQEQLQEKASRLTELEQTVADLELAGRLDQALVDAGTIDLEASRLLAEQALRGMEKPDESAVVAELCQCKPHLFRARTRTSIAQSARPEDQSAGSRAAVTAAEQARATGNRTDLLRYLRLRRRAR